MLESSLGGITSVINESWNGAIPDGGSVEIGFQASGSPIAPTSVSVNDTAAQPG